MSTSVHHTNISKIPIKRNMLDLPCRIDVPFSPFIYQNKDSPLLIFVRKPIDIQFKITKNKHLLSLAISVEGPTKEEFEEILQQANINTDVPYNTPEENVMIITLSIPKKYEISKGKIFESSAFIGISFPKESNIIIL